MTNYILSGILILTGIIHLAPVVGVLGVERLWSLYGVTLTDPNLVILMRHRAILFGLLGLFMISAAFIPRYQLLAISAGLMSLIAFIGLGWSVGGYNGQISRAMTIDIAALASLVVGLIIYLTNGKLAN